MKRNGSGMSLASVRAALWRASRPTPLHWSCMSHARIQVSIRLDGPNKALEYNAVGLTKDAVRAVFKDPEVENLFDRNWHKIALSVQAKSVSLYLDCKHLQTLPIEDREDIDMNGKTVIGKRVYDSVPIDVSHNYSLFLGPAEFLCVCWISCIPHNACAFPTLFRPALRPHICRNLSFGLRICYRFWNLRIFLQFDLQRMVIYCDSKHAELETCCDLPKGPVSSPPVLGGGTGGWGSLFLLYPRISTVYGCRWGCSNESVRFRFILAKLSIWPFQCPKEVVIEHPTAETPTTSPPKTDEQKSGPTAVNCTCAAGAKVRNAAGGESASRMRLSFGRHSKFSACSLCDTTIGSSPILLVLDLQSFRSDFRRNNKNEIKQNVHQNSSLFNIEHAVTCICAIEPNSHVHSKMKVWNTQAQTTVYTSVSQPGPWRPPDSENFRFLPAPCKKLVSLRDSGGQFEKHWPTPQCAASQLQYKMHFVHWFL